MYYWFSPDLHFHPFPHILRVAIYLHCHHNRLTLSSTSSSSSTSLLQHLMDLELMFGTMDGTDACATVRECRASDKVGERPDGRTEGRL